MKRSLYKRIRKRIISFALAAALVTNTVPMNGLSEIASFFSVAASAEDSPAEVPSDFYGNTIIFDDIGKFVKYCKFYHDNTQYIDNGTTYNFAEKHQNDILTFAIQNGNTTIDADAGFAGLGTEDKPFNGTIKFSVGPPPGETYANYSLTLPCAFFSHVYDSVKLSDSNGNDIIFDIKRSASVGENDRSPLFAQNVHHNTASGAQSGNWIIRHNDGSTNTYSGVIGEIKQNAVVNLTYDNETGQNVVSNSGSVGAICGTMETGSTLDLKYTETNSAYSITSTNGSAGGLVGEMKGTAHLNIKEMPAASQNKSVISTAETNGYAGGLVGDMVSTASITPTSPFKVGENDSAVTIPVSGNITGVEGAGGLFGRYVNSAADFDLKDYDLQNTPTVYAQYCGGVFGVLENNKGDSASANTFTIKNTNSSVMLNAKSGTVTTYSTNGYFGGIAGKYTTDNLTNSVIIDGLSIYATAQAAFAGFGGAFGIVDSAAYVTTLGDVSVNATGSDKPASFGGLVGVTSQDKGVFVDINNFKLTSNNFHGGGIVGTFNNGVLRLSGTTDMTAAKPASGNNYGQLVGVNNNVLTYALGNGNDNNWTFKRSTNAAADDLGTWGEVVRISGIVDESNLSTNHTVTLNAAVNSMNSELDFAKTALNMQLNNKDDGYDCLLFDNESQTKTQLLASTALEITSDIDLSGTGITGFMRDGGSDIGTFTGTLNGNSHTVTLAVGETYGQRNNINVEETDDGSGQIYRHQYNGLFANLAGTVSNLTVDGTMNINNLVDDMNIGGIAAITSGNSTTTLNAVKAEQTVNYKESASVTGTEADGKNIGGFIGKVTGGNVTVSGVSSIESTFNLSGYYASYNSYGGAIGKVTAPTFNITIGTANDSNSLLTNKLTVNATDVTNVGENSNSGGLIGYITKSGGTYSGRTVNVNNVEFDGCTIVNPASVNGGGFLGYSWQNTTANIKGVVVKGSSKIKNNYGSSQTVCAPNVGVMCYEATGKWVVDALDIQKMEMSDGANASLGMIVNKMYHTYKVKSGDKMVDAYQDALYLDVLNSGYTLSQTNGDIQLPASTVFDEIAAYSAQNGVIDGGSCTGVISINMNNTRAGTDVNGTPTKFAKVTETGTYQNRLKIGNDCANSNSRYYYNIDVMDNTKGGQNLLLWSLSKYADPLIQNEFGTTITGTTLGGDTAVIADLTGLSFYPLKEASENYEIKNLTLTFDYSGIYTKESESAGNTDNYVRDPALQNQHYLMHSGLFIDQPKVADNATTNHKITINGELKLAGTFLEDSTHQGVLISGTMYGDLVMGTNGKITLDGITPKTIGDTQYQSGYLLINNIERGSDLVPAPKINIQNVSTTTGYSTTTTYDANGTTATVAKSLIGAASGKGLNITFSKIKLDARDGNSTDSNLFAKAQELYNAYGTYNSIFTASTLMASIKTDQSAVLEYNYTYDEDWGGNTPDRNVTYGKEIKESKEYKDKERKYYPNSSGTDVYFVNPVDNTKTRIEVYAFDTGFLPYVKKEYDATLDTNSMFYREIKVNVLSAKLTIGCGTYNDPYIIKTISDEGIDAGEVLTAVAKFISSGNGTDLTEICLPKKSSNFDTLAENTTGKRWCTDKNNNDYHDTFKFDADNNRYTNGSNNWTVDNVRLYLAGAYYKVESDVVLDSTYLGLGCATDGATGNYAFRGVIVGSDVTVDGVTRKVTITNKSDAPFINVSNGSVVKDVNIIVQNENIKITQDKNTYNEANFGYHSNCKYYGGIIGEVMGGDNIIDNSYVNYNYTVKNQETNEDETKNSTITLTGTNGTIVPVGGYVGVVVFGAVIFKNMTADKTTVSATGLNVVYSNTVNNKTTKTTDNINLASEKDSNGDKNQEAWAAIYVNPIVGRVINGYAVNETKDIEDPNNPGEYLSGGRFSVSEDGNYHDEDRTQRFDTNDNQNADKLHTLKNGTKHYSIADINKNETDKLDVYALPSSATDGEMDIPNSQAFFILSLITQSCAGTATVAAGAYANSLSYGTYSTKEYGESSNTQHVYGMSHNAEYDNVGTTEIDSTNVSDYKYLASQDTAANTAVPYIIRHYTKSYDKSGADKTQVYNARCVTSTLGYYDINLAENEVYNLPDSFRGLGTIGYYDNSNQNGDQSRDHQTNGDGYASRANNKYCLKVNIFDGKNCTINEDIYLNKFSTDNYLSALHRNTSATQSLKDNVDSFAMNTNTALHGVGLFDSIVMKNNNSWLKNFTLNGSVHTEVYTNTYKAIAKDQKVTGANAACMWHSVSGVVGSAINGTWVNYENIKLNSLKIRGSNNVGGLLGISGNKSTTVFIQIQECTAGDLSIDLTGAGTDSGNPRSAAGAFVGKVKEGGVIIYGTDQKDKNESLTNKSTVLLSKFSIFANEVAVAGGLVGYAGHGVRAYDMEVKPKNSNSNITLGTDKTQVAGGICGLMQTAHNTSENRCLAIFQNCTVEQINVKAAYAGGLYGGTWSNDWAVFSLEINNCKVLGKSKDKHNSIEAVSVKCSKDLGKNINNSYAGGLVGKGYVVDGADDGEYNVLISNTTVKYYDIKDDNAKDGKDPISGSGGFIGYADTYANKITLYIHDSSVEYCKIGETVDNVGNYAGGAVGRIFKNQSNKLLGYNIKLDHVTSDSDQMGAWIGYLTSGDTGTEIQFDALAIYGNGFTKNVGNDVTLKNTSFVFADYGGKCNGTEVEGETTYPTNVSSYNCKDENDTDLNVTMPKYPYVNINPQSSMGTGSNNDPEYISGDGAVLYGTNVNYSEYQYTDSNNQTQYYPAAKTMAAKIYSEISDDNNTRRYTTFVNAPIVRSNNDTDTNNTIDKYMKHNAGDDGNRISTYSAERGLPENSGVDDFAVVVIANTNETETTNLINRYIQLVTNTATDYTQNSSYYDIVVKRCEYDENAQKFVITEDATGLTWTKPKSDNSVKGSFKINGSKADANETTNYTFTLVDVQFKDPLYTDKIAYHLYVPVYTIKQLQVKFSVAVKTGTEPARTDTDTDHPYTDLLNTALLNNKNFHIDAVDNWVTKYIRFSYTAEDLNILLDSNEVKWNNHKKVYFNRITYSDTFKNLPDNTYMILVDRNGGKDKMYHANISDFHEGSSVPQTLEIDFHKFKDDSNHTFEEQKFNDLIASHITASTEGTKLYKKVNGSETYDVYLINENGQNEYYTYDPENATHSLSVPNTENNRYVLNEDYYISFYVPKSGNEGSVFYYTVEESGSELEGDKKAKVENVNTYKYTVMITDLFEQQTNDFTVEPPTTQIDVTNHTLTAKMTAKIKLNDSAVKAYMRDKQVYHSFLVTLDRFTESGVDSKIYGLDANNITAKYNIGSEYNADTSQEATIDFDSENPQYINIRTGDIKDRLEFNKELTISAYIEMEFDENNLVNEFPEKTSVTTDIGVNVAASSNIAYDENRLVNTSMTSAFPRDNKYYYREAVKTTTLNYNAIDELDEFDTHGKPSFNNTRIGINGKYSQEEYMPINTKAIYDVTALSPADIQKAKNLRLTVSLLKKTDKLDENGKVTSVEYVPINKIQDYLENKDIQMIFKSGTYEETVVAQNSRIVCTIPITGEKHAEYDDAGFFNFQISFAAKTGEGFTEYANYRVNLTVELLGENDNSLDSASDHIVYTNAKLDPNIPEYTQESGD